MAKTDTKNSLIRVPKELYERAKRKASFRKMSFNEYCKYALSVAIENDEQLEFERELSRSHERACGRI